MSRTAKPSHPGELLREDILPALGLTVTDAAAQLNVTRAALSRVLNGRAGISPGMALRLEAWLGLALPTVAGPICGWRIRRFMTCGKLGRLAFQR